MAFGRGVVVQLNDGNGAFGPAQPVISGVKSWGFVLANLNTDGLLDLAVMTGESRMDATAIIDYYRPLTEWLREQNKGETCGWH